MAEGAKYFVRASDDAPEKGPYSPKQLLKAQERGMLGSKATARVDGSEEWLPLADLARDLAAVRAEKRAKRARNEANDAHALAGGAPPRRVNGALWAGFAVALAGVALSVTLAAMKESSLWGVGLIFAGGYTAIRGNIRGALRGEDVDRDDFE